MRIFVHVIGKTRIGSRDFKINVQSLINRDNTTLVIKQIFGATLASAYATKENLLIQVMKNEVQNILSESEIKAFKTAASAMTKNIHNCR